MTRVVALALREIVERKLLFLGAALVAVITLLVPLMPLPGRYAYGEVVDISAYAFALLLVVGGGVVFGATTIGRDLSSGRIAFFFTRQLHAWEIWGGRVAGIFLTLAIAAFLVLLPATLVGGGLRHLWSERGSQELLNAAIFAILLPLAAHYMSVALRSRSAWLALDVVAICAASGVLWTLALPFLPYWFGRPRGLGALFALLALCLAVAGWAGLAKGRITPVAVHRWSALTLWSLVAVALLSFSIWRAWVFAASPQEIEWPKGWAHELNANGEWIGLSSGEDKGRGGIPHEFLMSARTGAWMRVDDMSSLAVSADKRTAVIAKRSWSWRPQKWFETTIQIVDLTARKPRARDTGIVLNEGLWDTPAISADGSRIAIRESGRFSVYSLPDEKLLAAFPMEETGWPVLLFRDAGTLQVVSWEEGVTVISTFDIARRERVSRNVFTSSRYLLDRTGGRVALTSNAADKVGVVAMFETISGMKLGEIHSQGPFSVRRAHWLSDGGLALATIAAARLRRDAPGEIAEPAISIHSVDGAERLRVPLPGAQRIVIAGEQREGELIVLWADNANVKTPCAGKQHVVAIDLASGALRELPIEGWAAASSWRMSAGPGSASSRLFSTCDGKVVLYDAATGEKRTLLGEK